MFRFRHLRLEKLYFLDWEAIFFITPVKCIRKVVATQIFFSFSTLFGEDVQFDDHIFQGGMVQPPTRYIYRSCTLRKTKTMTLENHHFSVGNTSLNGGYSGWWFQIFFIFTPTWGRFPF